MRTFSVYLAGPITGKSYNESSNWREAVINILPEEIVAYSPLRLKGRHLKHEDNLKHEYDFMFATQRGIFHRDMNDCLMCDALLVNLLDSTDVSIGTVMEITVFWAQRKPIVLLMDDENIHNHPMIREACPFVFTSLSDGIDALTGILLPQPH